MDVLDEVPSEIAKDRWDLAAKLVNEGKVLRFRQGEDFEEIGTFRNIIYSVMKTRMTRVSVRQMDGGKTLIVCKKGSSNS